jgi:hypothetical protein
MADELDSESKQIIDEAIVAQVKSIVDSWSDDDIIAAIAAAYDQPIDQVLEKSDSEIAAALYEMVADAMVREAAGY